MLYWFLWSTLRTDYRLEWFQTTEKIFSQFWRYHQGHTPLECSGGGPFLASHSFGMQVAGSPRDFLACSHLIPISASVVTWPSPICVCPTPFSYWDTSLGVRAHSYPSESHLNLSNYIWKKNNNSIFKLDHSLRFQVDMNLGRTLSGLVRSYEDGCSETKRSTEG